MKKLFLFSAMLCLFAACSKDESTAPERPDRMAANVPHFYGMAMLDSDAPVTRGVANKLKVWSRPMAREELTVKFLNGVADYQQFVKDLAKEWENATADVHFRFVGPNEEAMIRIGFDYVRGMRSSWSYTGTDLLSLLDDQTEPTMHFAEWRRASDAQKRSDVLRAFGQTLGLELEFRHPDFNPGWVVDADGQIDEQSIREYWEYELAEFISWEELKKMVLDPINTTARFISKTDKYDPESVMNWPFYEEIASALEPIKFDSDYKTKLSTMDKKFIASLYGEPDGGSNTEVFIIDLIEFDYTGTKPQFKVTTTGKLRIQWDQNADDDISFVEVPSGQTSLTSTVTHDYFTSKRRRIVISEEVEAEQKPKTSSALTAFDFNDAAAFRNIHLEKCNKALEKVTVQGGWAFIWQLFDFSSQPYLKQLYLIETQGSRVTVANCPNLEVLATSPYVWKPVSINGPQLNEATENEVEEGMFETVGPTAVWPNSTIILKVWPGTPLDYYSLSDTDGNMGVNMYNCPNLKSVSLENTHIKTLDFSNLTKLDYIYLSSQNSYIVGGGTPGGQYLLESLQTLPSRVKNTTGLIVIRGIEFEKFHKLDVEPTSDLNFDPDTHFLAVSEYYYSNVVIQERILKSINQILTEKNWQIVWDSGCLVIFDVH